MRILDWNIEKETGYKPITTFYTDFSIADNFGESAIKDTFKNGLLYAKTDYKVLTEFVMVLNWKMWEHCNSNKAYALLYDDLWLKMDKYVTTHLQGEELKYYYRTTD